MKKKILLGLASVAVVIAGVALTSAFEAHIINVTAHIENALNLNNYGLNFGTVFPQEWLAKDFTVSLSESFIAQNEATTVSYKIVQKPKPWIDNFDSQMPAHRSLTWIDPDNNGSYSEGSGKLTITTGPDVEDLFGQFEQSGDWTAPRKMMRMGGNFTIETKVTADPAQYPGAAAPADYQGAGILVYESDGNVVRLELTAFSGLGSYAVYMESQEDANKVGKAWSAVLDDTVYLRLSRNNNVFKGEYSSDGLNWSEVSIQSGEFENENIGNYPLVGVAVVDNNESGDNTAFSADFDYVSMNGQYQDFCRFLSKMKAENEEDENDTEEPSYYNEGPETGTADDACITVEEAEAREANGTLDTRTGDTKDTWLVDLKVPPIAGFVGQDWPETCRQDWVIASEADYGCDLWIEVTDIVRD